MKLDFKSHRDLNYFVSYLASDIFRYVTKIKYKNINEENKFKTIKKIIKNGVCTYLNE